MRDAIAWSYDLLSADDQAILRRLSVFVGGCTLDAAEAVVRPRAENRGPSEVEPAAAPCSSLIPHPSALDVIASLVGQSMVRQDRGRDGEARFALLETIREFAAERLAASGEEEEVRGRHAAYFLALAIRLAPLPYLLEGDRLLGQFQGDLANLRAARHWYEESGDAVGLLRLVGALARFWFLTGDVREGREWAERAVRLGRAAMASNLASGLFALAVAVHMEGDEDRALALVEEGLARSGDDLASRFSGLTIAGLITLRLGLVGRAAAYQEAALALLPGLGEETWVKCAASSVLGHLGNIAVGAGDVDRADAYFREALERQRALGYESGASHPMASHPIAGLGDVARARGDQRAAMANYQTALKWARHFHDTRAVVYALGGVAGTLAAAGAWKQAARLFGATEALHETAGFHFDLETMDRQRALGLPEPWQRGEAPFGAGHQLRESLKDRPTSALSRIPDPQTAARLWAEGRTLPIEEALAAAATALPGLPSSPAGLTMREQEVLRHLAEGKTDQEIATALFISRRTAATPVRHIFDKLGVTSRAAAAAQAVRLGLA
jgi:non-specific serine/threonine protein kinase